ncbi:hypothetical protein BDR04DRAFT_1093829 [Suillus decipiens]|nr:hypothetical protein BDR04DRAFT_1093829 [Suillus decipiens]
MSEPGWSASSCRKGSRVVLSASSAVVGGSINGENYYIIAVTYQGGFYPTFALSQNEKVWFGYRGETIEHKGDFYYLNGPGSSYQWVRINGALTSDKVGNRQTVRGGWEADGTQYSIAQVYIGENIYCGKVKWNDCAYIACENGECKFETYNVLVFA